ncbi:hypothetical protein [Kurthia massiliensis]|uniref:hypothetical protein n=1 Tax=Kurthia massiliensis TaxID=1033739 RepID=UPI00028845B5|nr:hypothetical protein [Kurthia massiliensis]
MRKMTTRALFWLWIIVAYVFVFAAIYIYRLSATDGNLLVTIGFVIVFSIIFLPIYIKSWRNIIKREARNQAKQHLRF